MTASAQIPSPQSLRKLAVNGGNLFAIALEHLGDPLQWTRIAALNNLGPDPFLPADTPMELVLPPVNASLTPSGILGA
jgi:hypothetical protein